MGWQFGSASERRLATPSLTKSRSPIGARFVENVENWQKTRQAHEAFDKAVSKAPRGPDDAPNEAPDGLRCPRQITSEGSP